MTQKELISKGKEWSKGAETRVYLRLEDACRIIGLEVERYGSGSPKKAVLNGEKISNTKAFSFLNGFDIYFDRASGGLGASRTHSEMLGLVRAAWEKLDA